MSNQEKINPLISVKELSEWLNISQKVIYRKTNKKEIPHVLIGGSIRFDKNEITNWLKSHSVATNK